jgi:quercetin dioxygenase-like cupin family protein
MKMTDCPFTVVDWNVLKPEEHKGEPGTAYWRTKQCGPMRVRMVEYSPGYVADHWCKKGHVLFVLEGELETTLADGSTFMLYPGNGYLVADDVAPHRTATKTGAKLFIVN